MRLVLAAAVSFWVGGEGRARIEVPSADDLYHVLSYRSDPDAAATEYAVLCKWVHRAA